jgi:hypothetical protein
MEASDLTLSAIIVIIYLLLYLFNIFSVGIQRIKDNWPVYRCQPLVMPFAAIFGHETGKNFTYCIQNIQTNFMGELLKPMNLNIGILGSITGKLSTNMADARGFMSNFRFDVGDIFSNIFATLFNVMVEIQRLIINIKDVISKFSGVVVTLIFVIDGAMKTMTSAWDNPMLGGLVRFLCFHPETKLTTKNGEIYSMKDIPLNSILSNGTRVCSVMQISNLDKNGDLVEKMYKLKRTKTSKAMAMINEVKAADDDIIVSGSHLVYDVNVDDFVHVKDLPLAELTDIECPVLYCLITTDHTIPIGDWIFHDWEDSNGSEPKNISS